MQYAALQICSPYMLPGAIKSWWKALYIKPQMLFMIYDETKLTECINTMICDTLEKIFSNINHLLVKYSPTYIVQKFEAMTSPFFKIPAFSNKFGGRITSSESVSCGKNLRA